MFDSMVADTTGVSEAQAVDAWARVESAACARRLAAMVTMLDTAHTADGSADREQWCLDNWAAVCAHIGAAQRITSGAASGLLLVGTALRDRFPHVGAVFTAGLISYQLVRTIVYRGLLVTDPTALAALDTALARALRTWEPLSVDKTEHAIDAFIEEVDPHAVRRTHASARSRCLDVTVEDGSGMATLFGTLFATDAKAFDTRIAAIADTVCPADPRTTDQRRADAAGALAHGADRLACLCGTEDCPAALTPPSTGVVIHLIAHHDTITPPPDTPRTDRPMDPLPDNDNDNGGGDGGDGDGKDDGDGDGDSNGAGDDSRDDRAETDGPDDPCAAGTHGTTDHGTIDHGITDHGPVDPGTREHGATDEQAGLDGLAPPRFSTALRDMTITDLLTNPRPDQHSTIRPAVIMGGAFLPGSIARRTAPGAVIVPIIHPGQAPPEPRHTPSKTLADFIRCRDLTCRFPGCRTPATTCDIDHAIPWPYGPTQASNLRCLCRRHHLLKTFWPGWRDRQFPDGIIDWIAPDGRTHTTAPGSRLLFPELCEPTAPAIATEVPERSRHTTGLTMPRRRHTRKQDRDHRINHERTLNQAAVESETAASIPPF